MKGEICMREKEIRVLEVKPHEYPKEFILENSLEAMQEAVGGLIDIIYMKKYLFNTLIIVYTYKPYCYNYNIK